MVYLKYVSYILTLLRFKPLLLKIKTEHAEEWNSLRKIPFILYLNVGCLFMLTRQAAGGAGSPPYRWHKTTPLVTQVAQTRRRATFPILP